jgi:hypothetical protein
VSFVAITLCIASERVFIVISLHFVTDSVRKILVTPSYIKDKKKWDVKLSHEPILELFGHV